MQSRNKCYEIKLCSLLFLMFSFAFPSSSIGKDCEPAPVDYEKNCGVRKPDSLKKIVMNACFELKVKAENPWNASGLHFIQGEKYKIDVIEDKDQVWRDGGINSLPTGWTRDHEKLKDNFI